jgi:hypothetical protein
MLTFLTFVKLLTIFNQLSVDKTKGGVQQSVWHYGGTTLEPSAFCWQLCFGSGLTLAI